MRPVNEREQFLSSLNNPLVRAYAFACFGNLIVCYHSHKITNEMLCDNGATPRIIDSTNENRSGKTEDPDENDTACYARRTSREPRIGVATDPNGSEEVNVADQLAPLRQQQVNVVQCSTLTGDVPVSSVCLPAQSHRHERVGVRAAVASNNAYIQRARDEGVYGMAGADTEHVCDPIPQVYSPQHTDSCTSATTHTPPTTHCSGSNFQLTHERRMRLISLDDDPTALHNHIHNHPQPSHRLGVMYERLLEFFLSTDPQYTMVSSSLQVFDAGTGVGKRGGKCTIGEFDFVYHDHKTDEIVHLESAIKYFMSYKEAEGKESPGGGDEAGKDREGLYSRTMSSPARDITDEPREPPEGAPRNLSESNSICAESESLPSRLSPRGTNRVAIASNTTTAQGKLSADVPLSEFIYRWLGPGRKDSLERKLNLMLKRQIQLSMCTEAEEVFAQLTKEYNASGVQDHVDGNKLISDVPDEAVGTHMVSLVETTDSTDRFGGLKSIGLLNEGTSLARSEYHSSISAKSNDCNNEDTCKTIADESGDQGSTSDSVGGIKTVINDNKGCFTDPSAEEGNLVVNKYATLKTSSGQCQESVSNGPTSHSTQLQQTVANSKPKRRVKAVSCDLTLEDPSYLFSRFPSTEALTTNYKHHSHGASTELRRSSSSIDPHQDRAASQSTQTRHRTQANKHTRDVEYHVSHRKSIRPTAFRVTIFGELYTHSRLVEGSTNPVMSTDKDSTHTFSNRIPAPVGTHPDHHRGVWYHLTEFGAAKGFEMSRFGIVVGKQRWLCPGRDTDEYNWGENGRLSEGLYDETVRSHAEMYEHLVRYLHPTDFPTMVIEYGGEGVGYPDRAVCKCREVKTQSNCACSSSGRILDCRVEIRRMFIVCDSWPRPWPPNKRSTEHIR